MEWEPKSEGRSERLWPLLVSNALFVGLLNCRTRCGSFVRRKRNVNLSGAGSPADGSLAKQTGELEWRCHLGGSEIPQHFQSLSVQEDAVLPCERAVKLIIVTLNCTLS